ALAPVAGAGRPPLERSLDARPHRLAGAASRAGAPGAARDLSPGGGRTRRVVGALARTGAGAARAVRGTAAQAPERDRGRRVRGRPLVGGGGLSRGVARPPAADGR